MQRRKFLKDTLLGFPILWLSPSLLANATEHSKKINACNKSVLVIGAGISGLAAAKKLMENGFTVTVLEAQNKVGGRLRTNRSLGIAFDEGASWIHGITGNPITDLAQQAGMTTAITDDESFLSYDVGGNLRTDTVFNNAETAFYDVLATLMNSGNANQSFETVFNTLYPAYTNDRLWKFFLSTYLTFDTGDLNNLSSLLYGEGLEFGGDEVISTNGYDTIPNYLATGLTIQLNQRVSQIDYTASMVEVTHNGTVSQADYVLVTVPLGVLKANSIEFLPALPTIKQNAIQKIGMNCVNKFLLTWDSVFWDTEQYISYTPVIKDKFNYFVNVNKYNPTAKALMTFAYADYARQTETMTDAEVIDEIMLHLRDIYGAAIPDPTNLLRTKWQENINSFGAYSYTAVGTEMQHYDDLAEEIDDKVFFAGEHTNIDYFSTAHGAYLSGIREADKLIAICAALPVTWLSSLVAKVKDNHIHIFWGVSSQQNNSKYIIEHSSDDLKFSSIGEIQGDGTSSEIKHYEFIHTSPSLGNNYYRIKQVDYDGKHNYSNTARVPFNEEGGSEVSLYPNPAKNMVRIKTSLNIKSIDIHNESGQLVVGNIDATNKVISVGNLPNGIYLLKITTEKSIVSKKILKNKGFDRNSLPYFPPS